MGKSTLLENLIASDLEAGRNIDEMILEIRAQRELNQLFLPFGPDEELDASA